MPLSSALHRISTNVRFLTGSLLLPEYAAALAERLFLTPPRMSDPSRLPVSTFFDFLDARSGYLEYRGRSLATWRWGPRDAPAVLLAHGWGGYAAQMRGFVPQLLAAGYRVVAYDQPAHGLSEGKLSGLPDFAGALARACGVRRACRTPCCFLQARRFPLEKESPCLSPMPCTE